MLVLSVIRPYTLFFLYSCYLENNPSSNDIMQLFSNYLIDFFFLKHVHADAITVS